MRPETRRLVGVLLIVLSLLAGLVRLFGLVGNNAVADGWFFALILCAFAGSMLWISGTPIRPRRRK